MGTHFFAFSARSTSTPQNRGTRLRPAIAELRRGKQRSDTGCSNHKLQIPNDKQAPNLKSKNRNPAGTLLHLSFHTRAHGARLHVLRANPVGTLLHLGSLLVFSREQVGKRRLQRNMQHETPNVQRETSPARVDPALRRDMPCTEPGYTSGIVTPAQGKAFPSHLSVGCCAFRVERFQG